MKTHKLNNHTPAYLPSSKIHVSWSGVGGRGGIKEKGSMGTLTQVQATGPTLNLMARTVLLGEGWVGEDGVG